MKPMICILSAVLLAGCTLNQEQRAELDHDLLKRYTPTGSLPEKPSINQATAMAAKILELSLKDYDSARIKYGEDFHWSYVTLSFTKTEYGWSLPVMVNAKNSFGAYTGYRTHYVYFGASGPRDITGLIERRLAGVP